MKNPIREFLNEAPGFVPARRDVEQWADEFDKLLNPWVSVEERLPEPYLKVFVADNHIGYIKRAYLREDRWFSSEGGGTRVYYPTHWMRIPPLPGVEE